MSYGGSTSYFYDDVNRLNQAVVDTGESATYIYDQAGNILAVDRTAGEAKAPTITAITPATIEAGKSVTVTITGTGLKGATLSIDNPDISISNVAGTATSLTAVISVPVYVRSGAYNLSVSNALGKASVPFVVAQPVPVITGLNPSAGPVSRIVTITGTGLSTVLNENIVTFNGTSATVIRSASTSIEAIVPAGATTGPVVVKVNNLASNGVNFSVTESQGAPTITQIFPDVSSADGGQRITITGTNFSADTKVYIGTSLLQSIAVVDSNTIKGVTPTAFAGVYDVKLTNVNGDGLLAKGFTYLPGLPERITAINPGMGLINIPVNAPVSVAFTRPVDRSTIATSSFSLTGGANNQVSGTFTFDFNDTVVTFKPTANLAANSTYVLALTQVIKSVDGIPLEGAYTASFLTSASADTTAPKVSSNIPAGAKDVPYNTNIVLVFSEPVNPTTVNQNTITVSNNGTVKSGTVRLGQQNTVVTFIPSTPFFPNSQVQVTVSGKVTDIAGNGIIGSNGAGSDYSVSFTTGTTMDLFPPQVLSINPPKGVSGVNRSTSISVTFSKPINTSSVNDQTFIVSSKGISYPGTYLFSNNNTVATYIPSQLLPEFSEVTVNVTIGVTDYAGNALNQAFTSTFTTQSGFDNFRPWITAVSPFYNQGGVPLNTRVELTFSERMNPLTINGNTFWLQGPEGRVPGSITVSADGLKAILIPSKPLLPNSGYSIRYASSMTDVAGNASLSDGWHYFSTGVTISDTAPLSVYSMTPDNGAKGVALNALITIKFNKPLAATSVNKDTVIVAAGGVPVEGAISLDDNNTRIRFRPANLILLNPNTFYEVTITTGVTDVAGNTLSASYVGGFTTGSASDTTPPALVSYTPTYNATNVPVDTVITLTFNEPLNPTSLNWWTSIRLTGDNIYGNVPTDISLSADRKTVTVRPLQPLFSWKRYYVSINGIEDNSGNTYNGGWLYFTTAAAPGTDGNALPSGATVWANPDSLFADGETTTTVTISNINRNGVLVPNGTKVAVTADTVFRQDSAGGTILGGVASATEPRLKIFTTLGGSITFTYRSVNRSDLPPGATVPAYIQVISVDAAERGINMIGQSGITLFRGSRVEIGLNPENLLANGSSTADVRLLLIGNNNMPFPAGRRIAVTADPVYRQDSVGGTVNGGVPALDNRFKIFTTISGGIVDFTYTAPVLQAGQSRVTYIQVAEVDDAGRIVGLLGNRQINLNGSSGYTAPQPVILTVSPSNGQWGVGLNAPVVASFSQSLDPATVNGNNFYVNGPNGRVTGTLTLGSGFNGTNTVVTFKPSVALAPYSTYWIYIGTGIKSASGNPLLSGYWGGSFSTAGNADITAPKVTRTNPADGITGVPVNTVISVEFNKPMEPSTLNPSTVLVSANGTGLSGRVGVTSSIYGYNTVATFIPDQLLPADTLLTVTVDGSLRDASGNTFTQPFTSTFTTQGGFDNFRPWITAVSPFYNQGGVPLNTRVELTFSERMNPLTINGNTFWLQGPEGRVPGNITVSPDGMKATLTLQKPLLPNSQYSIRYSSGMTDVAGNASLSDGWHYFYTGVTISDTTPLSVATMTPENGAKGVALNALITIKFNKPLAATSVNKDTVIVSAGGVPVVGSITLDDSNTRIRFRPANLILFNPNTFYEVTVTTGVTDVAGNTLTAPYVGSFTTGSSSDTTAPSLASYTPGYNATNVPVDGVITLTFSEAVNPTTVNWWSSVRLTGDGIYGNVPTGITVSTDRKTVTVKPYQPLFSWKRYYISINGIEDYSGNVYNGGWTYFTTTAASGTDGSSLPTGASAWVNPDSLFADGETTTTVTISNINRNGVLVPNGTKVAITADAAFKYDSAGGAILGGVTSASDPRLKIFTTLGGSITLTYRSANRPDLTPGASVQAFIQVLSVDAADRGINMIGQAGVTLFRGSRVDIGVNPESLLANGTSTSDVHLVLYGNNNSPFPAGRRIAVTADPVYRQDSAGGTINGGTSALDSRFKVFSTISGGIVDFTYTAPTFSSGQSGYAYIQVAEVDDAGRIVGLLSYRQIYLNGSSGYTAPQPVILAVSPSNGQWGAGLNARVVVSFSQSLDPSTVNGNNFFINGPNGRVLGTLTLNEGFNGPNTVVTFTPSVALAPYSTYWIYIGTGIKSVSGNPLLSGYWGGSFSTAGTADTASPKITRTNPADGITGVPVNTVISVEFNEPMEPSTLNPGTLLVSAGGTNLKGRVSVASGINGYNTVATFVPDQLLPADTLLTVTIDGSVRDASGNMLTQPFTSAFTTQGGIDNFRPWVTAVSPFYNQGGVPLNTRVELTFSERMNPLTINGNTFWLQGPEGRVPGNITVSADGMKATLTLQKPLLPNSQYSIRYSSGMTDVAGNASLSDGWHYFTTGITISDTIPLSVDSMTPENGDKGVALNALVSIKFNKPLAATSVNKDTVIVSAGGVPVEGSISLDDNNTRIRFRPANLILLNPNTFYEVTITTGVTDVAGNTLSASYVGGFTTGSASDTTPPALVSYTPTYNATNVPVDTVITLTFNEPLNPTTLNWWGSIRLTGDGIYGNVPTDITLSTDRKVVTIKPIQPLFSWKRYYVSINGIEDYSGNTYNGGWFYFTTAAAPGTDGNTLPTGATVWANPDSLFADGETTTTVIISNINRNGVLVPNGTKVAVTADTVFRQDSAGGAILGGVASASDPRLKIFTTLGGSITFTYRSVNRSDLTPGATVPAYIQVISVDAAERGINMIGQGGITLFRGSRVDTSLNPENLLANGTSTADVHLVLYGNNNAPWPAGRRVAVTADPVYRQDSSGGTINGGTPAIDSRFRIFSTISGGIVDFTYTAPAFQAGKSGYAFIQVAEVDDAGRIVGLLGYRQINLNGSSGYTAPQPVILTVSPSNGQWSVGLNAPVVASFSQSLDPATVIGNNFYVNGPNGRVTGTLTLGSGFNGTNTVVTFKPSVALAPYSTYWIYIGTGIKSASGNPLLSGYWGGSFSTSGGADTTVPKVTRTNPADGITGVPVNTVISVEFNEPMEPSTLNPGTVTLSADGANLSGRIGVKSGIYGYNTVATFVPDQLLPADTLLTVTIDGSVKDASGNPLTQPFTSTFTTQSGFDNFRPWITAVNPPNGSVDVPVNTTISVTFSEAINPLTINSNTFYINGPGGRVAGRIDLKTGNTVAVFTPSVLLFSNNWYSINVSGVTDTAGNGILSNLYSTFRTAYAAGTSPLPTGASLFINPDSLYANGKIYTTVIINNINISGTPAPNGTIVAVTAQPAYNQSSVGGVISGNSIGTSADGRFLLFQTLGASVTLYYTPPDLTSMRPGGTAPAVIQVASVDANTRPVNLIGQGTVTLFAIGSASISASPSTLVANGANTAKVTVTIRDRNGNLVPDGTPVGLTVAPVFVQNTVGGSFVDGTSGANDQVQIYKTVASQFTATYQTPASKGNGTAVIQAITVDASGNPVALINTANITLQ